MNEHALCQNARLGVSRGHNGGQSRGGDLRGKRGNDAGNHELGFCSAFALRGGPRKIGIGVTKLLRQFGLVQRCRVNIGLAIAANEQASNSNS